MDIKKFLVMGLVVIVVMFLINRVLPSNFKSMITG
jgi:FtsH-binding integral membrane protein